MPPSFSAAAFCSSARLTICNRRRRGGAPTIAFAAKPEELIGSATFQFARALAYALINVYVVKMAGVFMVTTSTIAIYTAIAPRRLAFFGYALAILLLFWRVLFRLELCRLPALGVSAEPQHLGRQLSASDIY